MRISDWSSDVCSSDRVAEEPERIGKRALVLSTPEQGASASALARELGGGAVGTFTGAAMHVPVSVVDEAASMASRLGADRSEEHTSELQSLMRISYAVFCLKQKNCKSRQNHIHDQYLNNNQTIAS